MNTKSFLSGLLVVVLLIMLAGSVIAGNKSIDKIKIPPLNDIVLPDVEKVTLDNGIILYLVEDHEFPVINARVRLALGDFLEPADKIGLGTICGEVMRSGGTARMTGDDIDEALESIGASVETGIGTTSGNASMNILSEYVDTGLEILADVLRTPQFDEEKIDIAKRAQRTAISSRNDDAFGICIREYRKIIYGPESPLARHTEYSTLDNISRDDLVAFHKMGVTPENVMIAVWGDFKKDEMIEKISKYFGDWASSGQKITALPTVDYEYKASVNYVEKENITQSTVLIGHIGGLTGDPDYAALTVANNVLSGGFGGRMFNEVRSKKGLAYSTGGRYTTNITYPGIFYNYVITKLESTAEAVEAVMHEVSRMQTDPPTTDELQKAKDAYLNSFVFKFDSKGEIINRMMDYDYYEFPQDFLYTVKKEIEQVTAEDVVDVCERRFKPDQMHIVVVGIADQFDRPLSEFGAVTNVDITIPSGVVEEEVVVNEETLAQGMSLLEKAAAACGGKDKFVAIKNGHSVADMVLVTPQMNFDISGESYFEFPFNSRETMNTPMGEIVAVSTEDAGWLKQGGQIMDMPPDQLADSKADIYKDLKYLFSQIGTETIQAVYLKSDELNGTPVEIIKLIYADDESFKLALDAKTYVPVAMMYFDETMMGPSNLISSYSDYREVSGVKLPFSKSVVTDSGDKVMETNLKSIEFNISIPAGTFGKP